MKMSQLRSSLASSSASMLGHRCLDMTARFFSRLQNAHSMISWRRLAILLTIAHSGSLVVVSPVNTRLPLPLSSW